MPAESNDAFVTVDLGDGVRRLTIAATGQFIRDRLNANDHEQAAAVAMQMADQYPDMLWPHLVAAQSLFLRQQTGPGLVYIDRALGIDPGNVPGLVIKARLSLQDGAARQALQLIDAAVGSQPADAFLQGVRAEMLVDMGDVDAARNGFLRALELDSRNVSSLLGLSHLPGDNVSDDLLRKVEFFLESGQLSSEDRIKAHFALAQAWDRKGEVARHFAHLDAGNALKNRAGAYDPRRAAEESDRIVRFFTAEYFECDKELRGNPANIIFIVGFPRCGSTLVEQILSSHPDVSSAGETYALRYALRAYRGSHRLAEDFPDWIAGLAPGALSEIADDYLRRVARFNIDSAMTDKALGNYRFVGMIHLLFPNAKVINVQRDPIDTCYSCYKNLFYIDSVPFTYSLENLASHYRNYRRVVRHWHEVLPGKIHTMSYEDLVGRQEAVTRDLLEYCGLAWNDACLAFHENARAVQTSSNSQVRQPLYDHSIRRWKKYEAYLAPLLDLPDD